jgi:AAA15 family ATPase/GTPase
MLLRLILKNFLSFDGEMQFDMFPNMKRTLLSNHIYKQHSVPLLKQAAIYGPNAGGKSNLVKALEFLRAFVINKDFLKNLEIEKFYYLLKNDAKKEPISLSIEFWSEQKKQFFFYEIEVTTKSILKESLYESFPKKGEFELVSKREGRKVEFSQPVNDVIKKITELMLAKNPLSSLLSIYDELPISPDTRCKTATKWFKEQLEIIGIHSFSPILIDLLRKNERMMSFVGKLVKKLDVGVSNLNIQETDFDAWAQSHLNMAEKISNDLDDIKSLSLNENNTPVLSIDIENGIKKVYQLIFNNMGKNGFKGYFEPNMQSDGTLRALTLLPALYYACKEAKVVVVDEINFCLSPTMVKGIVEYFADNNSNGQFIFTTHDIQLLDEESILRSDEIWFVDKREGASVLYTHNDFKEHHTISRQKGYNEGRYGAIRFVKLYDYDD